MNNIIPDTSLLEELEEVEKRLKQMEKNSKLAERKKEVNK